MSIPNTIGAGTPHLIPFDESITKYYILQQFTALAQRKTFDFSGVLPSGAKAAIIRAFGYASSTTVRSPYGLYRIQFSESATGTPAYQTNTACVTGIGYMPANGYIGGDIVASVLLDSNNYFYGYCDSFDVSSVDVYCTLLGWCE